MWWGLSWRMLCYPRWLLAQAPAPVPTLMGHVTPPVSAGHCRDQHTIPLPNHWLPHQQPGRSIPEHDSREVCAPCTRSVSPGASSTLSPIGDKWERGGMEKDLQKRRNGRESASIPKSTRMASCIVDYRRDWELGTWQLTPKSRNTNRSAWCFPSSDSCSRESRGNQGEWEGWKKKQHLSRTHAKGRPPGTSIL